MKKKDYYQTLLTALAEPKLVAEAYEQYYKRVYERVLALNAELINNTDENTPDDEKSVVLVRIEGTDYIFRKSDLMNKFAVFNNAVQNGEIDSSSFPIQIENLEDHIPVNLDLRYIATALGENLDTCYTTWQGFSSIVNDNLSSAQDFINVVTTKTANAYSAIKDTVAAIYTTLRNAGSSISQKLKGMLDFCGYTSLVNDSSHVLSDDTIEMSNYTGVCPALAWCNGMDFVNGAKWFGPSQTLMLTLAMAYLAANIIKAVVSLLYNIRKKVYSFIGNIIKKTFIDPVDYKCSDPTLGYFKIPNKLCFRVSEDFGSSKVSDKLKANFVMSASDGLIFSEGPVLYRYTGALGAPSDQYGGGVYGFERYVKPIDAGKLYNVLLNFMRPASTKTEYFDPITETWNSKPTYGTILYLFNQLSEADLSIEKNAPEIIVYYGIILSYKFSNIINALKSFFIYLGKMNRTNTEWLLNESLLDDISLQDDFPSSFDTHSGMTLSAVLTSILSCAGIVSGLSSASNFSYYSGSWSAYGRVFGNPSSPISSVTNLDFLKLLTLYQYYDFSTQTLYSQDLSTAGVSTFNDYLSIDSALTNYSSVPVGTWTALGFNNAAKWSGFSIGSTGTILRASRQLQAGTDLDGAYIPYANFPIDSFSLNVDIISDSQHAANFITFLKGAAIAAAVIAAGIAIGSAVIAGISAYNRAKFTRDTLAFNYGDAVAQGDVTQANALYQQWKGYNLKANMMKSVFGTTTAVSSGASLSGFDSSNLFGSNDDVIKLIKSTNN